MAAGEREIETERDKERKTSDKITKIVTIKVKWTRKINKIKRKRIKKQNKTKPNTKAFS